MRSDDHARVGGPAPASGDPTPAVPPRWVDGRGVEAARRAALPAQELDAATLLFRLLGDVTRVRMLYALDAAGELCVGDLAGAVGAGESTVSHALRLLRTAGVVSSRRDGRAIFYRLADRHVEDLLRLTHQHAHHEIADLGADESRAAG